MKHALLVAIPAVILGLAACSSAASSHPTAAPSPAPAPTPTNGDPDAYACHAFHEAITTGVPASAEGEDTMTWLQSQTGAATPAVQQAIGTFISAWQATPLSQHQINLAEKTVKILCADG